MKLSKRLSMVASFVKKGSSPADIGTDHAYLPVYLILNGICSRAIAADIGAGPLRNAKTAVEEYGVEDKIWLIQSDGLKKIPLNVIDTVILAGMGGDLIRDILAFPDKDALRKLHIIAQPQSHSEKVRRFLMDNGFEIEREDICADGKHTYNCLSASYKGICDYPPYYEYYGELPRCKDNLAGDYFEKLISVLDKKRNCLPSSDEYSGQLQELNDIIKTLKTVIGEK